jgi:hypothetical protein
VTDVDRPLRKAKRILTRRKLCRWHCAQEDAQMCPEFSPERYPCTRHKGHAGQHVSCGWGKHGLKVWPR